jgi:hypothetical protein
MHQQANAAVIERTTDMLRLLPQHQPCPAELVHTEFGAHLSGGHAQLVHRLLLQEGSRMVFVPGPHDPGLGDLLPAVRLPEWCTEELQRTVPSAVFTTNPCR